MIVLDGGLSRELQRVGAPFRQPEWSALALMEAPDKVEQVHAEFAQAGAEVLTTDTYAVVPFHIGSERFAADGWRLADLAGQLARRAADAEPARTGKAVRVAGSLPPIFGSYRPDLFDAERVGGFLDVLVRGLTPWVDLWLGETLSSVAEAQAVMASLQGDNRPVWISFTVADGPGATRQPPCLRSGEPVEAAAAWAVQAKVDALLFNCSQPEVMEPAVLAAAAVFRAEQATIPIGVYANAFQPPADTGQTAANEGLNDVRNDLGPDQYAGLAKRWQAAGASVIGGCCGIGVEHIDALSRCFARGRAG